MNRSILLLSFITISFFSFSQIIATTSAGKQVVLNMDGTWRWANPEDAEKPCITNNTASITIHNLTGKEIYFYYGRGVFYNEIEYVKVIPGGHRTIDIITRTKFELWKYKWIVSYELYTKFDRFTYIDNLYGFDSGTFILTNCEEKDIKIYK